MRYEFLVAALRQGNHLLLSRCKKELHLECDKFTILRMNVLSRLMRFMVHAFPSSFKLQSLCGNIISRLDSARQI